MYNRISLYIIKCNMTLAWKGNDDDDDDDDDDDEEEDEG